MSAIGLPQMMMILTMMGLALWKTGWLRTILSIGLVIWGAFAFPLDPKIGGPLIGIGSILFIASVLTLKQRGEANV